MRKTLILLLGLLPFYAFADTLEIAGAELSYKHLNGTAYEVTLNLYTRCNGYSPDSKVPITVYSPDTNFKPVTRLADLADLGTVPQDCHTGHKHATTCEDTASNIPGIRKWKATTIFPLDDDFFCEYIFAYRSCCRTKQITTGAAEEPFYIDAYMNICDDPRNSSPQFVSEYHPYVAGNNCVTKGNMATGSISSKLTYRFDLTPPKANKSTGSAFNAPYSYREPLTHGGGFGFPQFDLNLNCWGFHVDSVYGDLSMFPKKYDEVTPVSVSLSMIANGKVISRVSRDLTYQVIGAGLSRIPIITGVDCTKKDTSIFLSGVKKCFSICSFDPDIDDTAMLFGNLVNFPAGATYQVEQGKKWPKAEFCWTPQKSDERAEPYALRVWAEDNQFPCNEVLGLPNGGKSAKLIYIYVGMPSSGIEVFNQQNLSLYPLPARDKIFADIPERLIRKAVLYDMTGRRTLLPYSFSGSTLQLNISELGSGTYMLHVYTDSNVYSGKVVVVR